MWSAARVGVEGEEVGGDEEGGAEEVGSVVSLGCENVVRGLVLPCMVMLLGGEEKRRGFLRGLPTYVTRLPTRPEDYPTLNRH
jgi:hypothetical protein